MPAAFLERRMESIVSRSEFPEDDEELDSRPNTHHDLSSGGKEKITRDPTSMARPRTTSLGPLDASPPSFDYSGATLDGRYFVEKQLGEGGMGVVYLCRHTIIDKKVAVKVLRSDLARNEEVTERFLNEARSASSIGNPHIIDISDFGRLPDGTTYFVMEFLTGTSLAEIVESEELMEPGRIGHVALQLCEGLAAAHGAGIVHRDLKPDNIFLIEQGSRKDFVKILDFGIAKATHVTTKLTQAGQVFGTPHYMSPEQANGDEVDARSDIYAVGVILYELATGQLPFDADNFMAILTQHIHREPPPPSTIDGLPPLLVGLEDVILKCLAKAPADRYQTMVELMSDLRIVFADVLPTHALERNTATDGYSTPQMYARRTPSRPQPVQATTRRKRHVAIYSITGVTAALLSATVVWSLTSSSADESTLAPQILDATPASSESGKSALEPTAAAPIAPKTQVAIAVAPLAAHVFEGDEDLGESPVMVEVGETSKQLEARLDGYVTKSFSVDGETKKLSIALEKVKPKTLEPITARQNQGPVKAAPVRKNPPAKKSVSDSAGVVNPWD